MIAWLLCPCVLALPVDSRYIPVLDVDQPPLPFVRYTTNDKFGRTITFYLEKGVKRLPLALLVLGSGGQSLWQKVGDRYAGGLQNLLSMEGKEKVRVLVVEKPGVDFCFQPPRPGSAEGCSEAFRREHTLERWTEANLAAMKASLKLPQVDGSRILAVGHSEGGIVVAKVAANFKKVTHVAVLAGGGPSQIEDLKLMMPDALSEWKKIQADPHSTTKFAWGHPYLRWSTFCAATTTGELLKSKAKVFLAAGTADRSVPIQSFDQCVASLNAKKREHTALRIEGADHGFGRPEDQGNPSGFRSVFRQVLDWFLAKT